MNRAQLKALAARQAMTVAATPAAQRPAQAVDGDEAMENASAQFDYSGSLPRLRRRVALTREQEYAYIRSDLVRLLIISGIALAIMISLLFVIR